MSAATTVAASTTAVASAAATTMEAASAATVRHRGMREATSAAESARMRVAARVDGGLVVR